MERYGRITAVEQQEKGVRVTVLMSEKVPRVGDSVRIRWGKKRSLPQNALYWKYLEFCLFEAGLQEKSGYVSTEDLHSSLKGHFLMVKEVDSHGIMVIREKSTTELDHLAFTEYMEKVDLLINSFFEINTSQFFQDYQDFYSQH